MRTRLTCLALLVSMSNACLAQDHLEPDASVFVNPDSYLLKVRHVFDQAFDDEVTLRALVLHSRLIIGGEFAIGIFVKDGKAEAFVLEPSSYIRASEKLDRCQKAIDTFKEDGEKVPPELLDEPKDLEKEAIDYRKIKATRQARPITPELAQQIKSLWDKMLLAVRHPERPILIEDGVTYYYSAWIKGWGEISGHHRSDGSGSGPKTRRLTQLALSIGKYARGKVDLDELKQQVEQARASINP
jgi:hypothetical protein